MTNTTEDWIARARNVATHLRAIIDGVDSDAASGETFAVVNPATGIERARVASLGAPDVDRAVSSARRVFESGAWSEKAPYERKLILQRWASLLENAAEELALLMTLDMGKPIADAIGEVAISVKHLRWFAEAIDKVYGEVAPLNPRAAFGYVTREPMGVVAAIVPWNYPLLMPMWKLAPALASGNSVLLKPAEQSPAVSLRAAQLALEAGLPKGVFNVVTGVGEVAGRALAEHRDVDKVAFTGSAEVGRMMMRYSADSNLKGVQLELGGKSAQIVLSDAPNLKAVADWASEGIYANAGQVCNAGSRLLVQRSIRDELIEYLKTASRRWMPNDPLNPNTIMGPLVSSSQLNRVLGYIEAGVSEGAKVAFGGSQALKQTGGFFVEPTIFTGVGNQMRIAREEIFGPVLAIVDFDSIEEAIAIANASEYGLAAGVWTSDVNTALTVTRKLRAGSVYVNCWDMGDNSMPVGGYKLSGFGRDKSLHAFDNYTRHKSTYVAIS
jgi:acyl-CoA reductase-like NAD-dependent aldehyde dehydrogenase